MAILLDNEHDSLHLTTMAGRVKDPNARRAVRSMLARGLLTLSEAAEIAGVSRQLARQWAADIRWQEIRRQRLADLFRKELKRGSGIRLVEMGRRRPDGTIEV